LVSTVFLLHAFCAGTYLALAGYVVARGARSSLNWACAALNLCFAHWSGCLAVSHFPGVSRETAVLFYSIGSFAWGSAASFAGFFAAAFLRPTLLRSKAFLVALFAPAILTIYAQWSGRLAIEYPETPWGFTYIWQDSPWVWAFFGFYLGYGCLALGAMLFASRKLENSLQAQQARLLGASGIVPFALATLTDVVLPQVGSSPLPDMAPDFMLVWAIALVFSIGQYRLFELSPAGAADEIVNNMSDALLLVDKTGAVARSNAAASELLGYTVLELRSLRLEQLFPVRLLDTESRKAQRQEQLLLRKGGGEVAVLFSRSPLFARDGHELGSVCVATDISELKHAEQRLRVAHDELETRVLERTRELSSINRVLAHQVAERKRSEEQYRLLIETMQEGLWVVDVDGLTTFVNPRLAELLEYEPDELARRRPEEFVDEPSKADVRGALARARHAGTLEADWLLRSKSDKRLSTIVRIAALRHAGVYSGSVLTVLDATERTRLQAQLTQADRMASLGILAAGVGHEINNPLTYVLASLEELEARVSAIEPSPEPLERGELLSCVRESLDGAQRVRDIVRGLRTFSRVEDQSFAPVDIHQALASALSMVRSEIRFRARLVKKYGELPSVLGDASRLSQVFLNLLVNACHAIGEGSVDDNEVRIVTRRVGPSVVVEVMDTGHGVPEEAKDRLFDPFFTTKDVGHGSGLGLWICHQTVTSHGGRIEVENRPERGALFRVTLPALLASGVRPAARPRPASARLPRGRALVIDDEVLLRRAFARALQPQYDLVLAESAERAQAILINDCAFDVVLCDLMMPGMSGMAWYTWLSTCHPDLAPRVVFMTGGAVTPEAREFLACTSNPVVLKPFEPNDLLSAALSVRTDPVSVPVPACSSPARG
jgi:PAS domain S-box-containing protein